jgi:hypothetical protein
MLAQEYILSVDQFEQLVTGFDGSPAEFKRLEGYKDNLEKEADSCRQIAATTPCPGENLASIMPCIKLQLVRLQRLWGDVVQKDKVRHIDDLKASTRSRQADKSPSLSEIPSPGKPAAAFPDPPAACA